MTVSHRRARGDGGATLVEFALVLPFLLLLGLGTVEMGMGWVANDRLETAAAQAARMAAISGSKVEADRDIIVTLQASLSAEALANLDRVVVFKSTASDSSVPNGCILAAGDPSQTGNSACNTYTGQTVRSASSTSMTGFGGGGTANDRYWAPSIRKDTLAGPPDYVGVWVRTTHRSMTGSFFGDQTLVKVSIFRIQPDVQG